MNGRLERFAPLSGVAAVACTIVAVVLYGTMPEFITDSPRELSSWLADDSGRILTGTWFDGLSGLFALWFAAVLRSHLLRHEGGSGRLSNLVFGAFVAAQACFWVSTATILSLAGRVDEDGRLLDPAAAMTLYDLGGMVAFVLGGVAIGTGLAAVAVVSLRHRALPSWLAYPAAVLAVVCIAPFVGWIGVIVSLLWVLVASIYLFRAMAPAAVAEPPAVTPSPPAAPTAA